LDNLSMTAETAIGMARCTKPRRSDLHIGGRQVWIVAATAPLRRRVERLAEQAGAAARCIDPARIEAEIHGGRRWPAVVILDIASDMEWGRRVIQRLKRAGTRTPVVVIAEEISREFGAKIVSEGVQYYFPRQFSDEEFMEVIGSLLGDKGESIKNLRDQERKRQ
jgi:DNA-binding NtrC family response regulator